MVAVNMIDNDADDEFHWLCYIHERRMSGYCIEAFARLTCLIPPPDYWVRSPWSVLAELVQSIYDIFVTSHLSHHYIPT
jgi:hypothetical protein